MKKPGVFLETLIYVQTFNMLAWNNLKILVTLSVRLRISFSFIGRFLSNEHLS